MSDVILKRSNFMFKGNRPSRVACWDFEAGEQLRGSCHLQWHAEHPQWHRRSADDSDVRASARAKGDPYLHHSSHFQEMCSALDRFPRACHREPQCVARKDSF